MPVDDALLFIDANKYLDIYQTDSGKKLLALLVEQKAHIFVTQQIVFEVQRNKTKVAADFLIQKTGRLKMQTFNVPDHLSGSEIGQSTDILGEMKEIGKRIKAINNSVDDLALGIMEQISLSKDEVSLALAPIFENAVPHCQAEIQRARNRKELGNPPGKTSDPIGDQLAWEQILSHFAGKKRLWIISRDGDYGKSFGGKEFLNSFLYDELCKVAMSPNVNVYLFKDLVNGITHFVEATGVPAKNQLSIAEAEEIENEEKSLTTVEQLIENLQKIAWEIDWSKSEIENFKRMIAQSAGPKSEIENFKRMIAQSARPKSEIENFKRMVEDMKIPKTGMEVVQETMDDTRKDPEKNHHKVD
ncbi:MAG: PIN domain-containing protein [Pirellulaceae bacterium]